MGKEPGYQSLLEHFSVVTDPRLNRTKKHPLETILFIGICSVIAGADSWTEMELFAQERKEWFSKYVDVSAGIPSHDTLARVFCLIDIESFHRGFQAWVLSLLPDPEGKIISLDGKTLRRAYAPGQRPLQLVQAWAGENHLMLGQIKVDPNSNEIPAIENLLPLLNLKKAIVTIDAIGTQTEIARALVDDKKADYVLAVKDNQHFLYRDLIQYFEDATLIKACDFYETTEKEHGRIETRKYWSTSKIKWLDPKQIWKGLQSIVMVEAHVIKKEHTRVERRFYISSLKSDPKLLAKSIREHWKIENSLHWVLDVAFREDDSRIRRKAAPQNFALLRRIALMLLKKDTTTKAGIKIRRSKAGWSTAYLENILSLAKI